MRNGAGAVVSWGICNNNVFKITPNYFQHNPTISQTDLAEKKEPSVFNFVFKRIKGNNIAFMDALFKILDFKHKMITEEKIAL